MPWISQSSKLISDVSLYKRLPLYARLNIIPFIIIHVIVLYLCISYYSEYEVLCVLGVPVSILCHIFSFLFSYWQVEVDAFMNYRKVHQINEAAFVKVTPREMKGDKRMEEVHSVDGEIYFNYQKRKYIFDSNTKQFCKLNFDYNHNFGHFKKTMTRFTRNEDWAKFAERKYGKNKFDVPVPTFKELYIEQALAPFFVFQLFCVALWLLDEYWYYAIFVLVMLLFFEFTVVNTRLKNFESLRGMAHKPYPVLVYRNRWVSIESSDLLPGDICFLSPNLDEPISADFLLLSGTCITNEAMLTGESTPQLKEPISIRGDQEVFSISKDAIHILFGGTRIIQTKADLGNKDYKAGENGCVCYVLRTGFDTSQGKLVRTILFSSQRVTANNWESLVFICFLLCFGLSAAGYVLLNGLQDPNRSRYKLLLESALIITSTVPPELPTELSLAVNNSLLNLQTLNIFCTEPFRIPFAGKVDYCCFDKTGTLTDEHLHFQGVSGIDEADPTAMIDSKFERFNKYTPYVMAACHDLTHVNKELVGDPMEKATLNGADWSFSANEVATSHKGDKKVLKVLLRFHFTSALSRMSAVVMMEHEQEKGTILGLVKGAPEVLMKRIKHVPDYYSETFLHYASQGKRVIAMAYKKLNVHKEAAKHINREEVESDLTFCGFLVFECPLKEDSQEVIDVLTSSSHRVIMITGDNPLTACEVAKELHICNKPILILEKSSEQNFIWIDLDSRDSFLKQIAKPKKIFDLTDKTIAQEFDMCVYGEGLAFLLNQPYKSKILSQVNVISRATPENKAAILSMLKSNGYTTLMCGDGTNDVGALKQSHVGIALLNTIVTTKEKNEKKKEKALDINDYDQGPKGSRAKRAKVRHNEKPVKVIKMSRNKAKKLKQRWMERLEEEKRLLAESQNVKLGDASIAAPITVKSASVGAVAHIIRQGRCTLVTTRQMFSILALNCLVHAYGLSVLYLDGIKSGDTQATITGFLIATCFLYITYSKPLDDLSAKKPLSGLFTPYLFFSIIGQFIVHLSALMYIVNEARLYEKGVKPKHDADFTPNLVNSGVFVLTTSMQLSTFATNYVGHPYMESLMENKSLFRCLVGCAIVAFIAAAELVPPFNWFIQLVPFPAGFKLKLLLVMVIDYIVAHGVERLSRKLFASNSL